MEGDPGALTAPVEPPPKKKGRTNTPWTAEEEQRLKMMRDAGRSWSEIAKVPGLGFGKSVQWTTNADRLYPCRLFPRGLKGVSRSIGIRFV